MDACFFDMLHHRPDNDSFSVRQRIDVDLECVFHKFINQYWLTRSRFDRLLNESCQIGF